MNREAAVPDDIVTEEAAPSIARRLRFDYHRRRPPVTDYLRIDDSLDAIGRARFPETWGRVPFFELLPFRIEKGRCVRTRIVSVEGKGVRLRSKRLGIPKLQIDAYRQVRKMFVSVLKELKTAVARGDLAAFVFYPTGAVRPLEFPDVVSSQPRWFFHHGVLRQRTPGRDVARRVLIRNDDFVRWLSQNPASPVSAINSAPRVLIRDLGEIVRHIRSAGYKLRKPTLRKLVERAAKVPWEVTGRAFEKLWTDGRLKPVKKGGRFKGQKGERSPDEPDEEQEAELVALMARLLEGRSLPLVERAVEATSTTAAPKK